MNVLALIVLLQTAPTVTDMNPLPGSIQPSPTSVVVVFSHAIDPSTVSPATVTLVGRGPDLAFGTGDDVVIIPGSVGVAGNVLTLDLSAQTLPDDLYRLRLSGTAAVPTPHAGLFAYWKLNEGAGAQASDGSGNGRHGTLNGAAWAPGLFGNALDLNGNAERLDIDAGIVSPDWTAAMWLCRRGDVQSTAASILDSNSATGTSLRLEQIATGDDVGITEYTAIDYGFGYATPSDRWVHLTFTSDSANARLYVNGVLQNTAPRGFNLHVDKLGSATTTRTHSMIGRLSEVQIYGRVLTGAEISSLAALNGAIRSMTGDVLNGEFPSGFPSGDTSAGGDFVTTFTVSSNPPASPKVMAVTPAMGSAPVARPANILVTLDRGIEPATVAKSTVRVIRAGGDGTLGTGDDVPVPLEAVVVAGGAQIRVELYDPNRLLPRDLYQVTVSGTVVADPPEAGRWTLDELTGPTAADSSGNGNHGTHVNGPTVIAGKLGRALALNGTSQSVDIPDADVLSPQVAPGGQITVSAWVRVFSWPLPNTSIPFLSKAATGQHEYSLRIHYDRTYAFHLYSLNGQVFTEVRGEPFSSQLAFGRWQHVAGTTGDALPTRIYLDGGLIREVWMGNNPPGNGTAPLQIGRTGPTENSFFNGHIDDVRIYGTALTEAQVVNLATLGGAVRDTSHLVLDGEFTGTFPSGNGAAGGDFVSNYFLDVPGPFTMVSPPHDALVPLQPTFEWTASASATSYTLEISRDGTFTQLDFVQAGITSTSFTLPVMLPGSSPIAWRVTAFGAGEGTVATSAPFSMNTSGREDLAAGCGSTGLEFLVLLVLRRLRRRIRSA